MPSPPHEHDEDVVIEAPGAEEVVVVPWPLLLRHRVAARVASSARFRWWVMWTVLAGLFSVGFTITILSVSLPRIARDLDSDTATLTWVITGPMLAFGILGPTLGKAADIWGQKRVYVFGLSGAAVFAALTAIAWNAPALVAFRILGAAIGASTGPASMAIIMREFPAAERVRAMGYWSLIGAGAPVLGVVAGGPIVEHFSWRWIFAIQAPVTVAAVIVATVVLPETGRGARRPLDVKGAATLSLGVTSLLFALNRGPVWGWSSPGVVTGFVLAPIALVAFVAVERVAAHPLLDLRWLRIPNFVLPISCQFFMNFAYMGSFIVTPLLLDGVFGYGETKIGLISIARPLSFSVVAPVAGYLTVRVGERAAALTGSSAIAASMLVFTLVSPDNGGAALVMLALALAGIGNGVASPAMSATLANAVPEADLGIAGAAQQLLTQVGQVAGIQLAQTLQESREASVGALASFHEAYLLLGVVGALAIAASFFVRSTGRGEGAPEGALEDGVAVA